jgi:hypothetical protein
VGAGSATPFPRPAAALAALSLLAVAALACAIGFFAHPLADDYCIATMGRHWGVLEYVSERYQTWSGRWFGLGLLTLVLSSVDLTRHYAVLLAVLTGITLASFYSLGRSLLGSQLSRASTLGLAATVFILLWAGRPAPQETHYWFSAAIPYQLSLALATFVLAGLSRPALPGVPLARRSAAIAGLALLALCTTGTNEMIGAMLCVVLCIGVLVGFHRQERNRFAWAFALGVTIIGLAIVLLAPGNAERAKTFSQHHDLGATLRFVLGDIRAHFARWVLDPKLLSATLLLAINPKLARLRPACLSWRGVPWRALVPMGFGLMLALGTIGPRWAAGRLMFDRVLDANYAIFLIGWLATALVWTRSSEEPSTRRRSALRLVESAAFVTFAVSLLFTGNAPVAFADLTTGRAQTWDRTVQERYAILARARQRGVRDVSLPRAHDRPKLFPTFGIGTNPNALINRCWAGYFGVRSVRLRASRTSG